jgi:hypothetical protein
MTQEGGPLNGPITCQQPCTAHVGQVRGAPGNLIAEPTPDAVPP